MPSILKYSLILLLLLPLPAEARKHAAMGWNRCGFMYADSAQEHNAYDLLLHHFECRSGERIASVGAQGGSYEVRISLHVPCIDWTLQDIDTGCLNRTQVDRMIGHYSGLYHRSPDARFELVTGTATRTNLPESSYDRVLLSNVFHELSDPVAMLQDIRRCVKPSGCLVVMEKIAAKPGERRADCHHVKPYEPDLVSTFLRCGFALAKKTEAKTRDLRFYTFYPIPSRI